jgi:hypothetical protein
MSINSRTFLMNEAPTHRRCSDGTQAFRRASAAQRHLSLRERQRSELASLSVRAKAGGSEALRRSTRTKVVVLVLRHRGWRGIIGCLPLER